jgi:hypothetical protein
LPIKRGRPTFESLGIPKKGEEVQTVVNIDVPTPAETTPEVVSEDVKAEA